MEEKLSGCSLILYIYIYICAKTRPDLKNHLLAVPVKNDLAHAGVSELHWTGPLLSGYKEEGKEACPV